MARDVVVANCLPNKCKAWVQSLSLGGEGEDSSKPYSKGKERREDFILKIHRRWRGGGEKEVKRMKKGIRMHCPPAPQAM